MAAGVEEDVPLSQMSDDAYAGGKTCSSCMDPLLPGEEVVTLSGEDHHTACVKAKRYLNEQAMRIGKTSELDTVAATNKSLYAALVAEVKKSEPGPGQRRGKHQRTLTVQAVRTATISVSQELDEKRVWLSEFSFTKYLKLEEGFTDEQAQAKWNEAKAKRVNESRTEDGIYKLPLAMNAEWHKERERRCRRHRPVV